MAGPKANMAVVALGTGTGLLLVTLVLGDPIAEAIIKGILAGLIAAVLVTIVEKRG